MILSLSARRHGAFRASKHFATRAVQHEPTCFQFFSSIVKKKRWTTEKIQCRLNSTAIEEQAVRKDLRSSTIVTSSGLTYEAHVEEGGKGISLEFPSTEETVFFHAPWLWSNDPAFVHTSSGQRLRTPGQYPGTRIASVEFVSPNIECDGDFQTDDAIQPIPPPPRGCAHPIGIVFKRPDACSSRSPLMLRVAWEQNDTDDLHSISYFNVEWLQEWRYDNKAIQQRRALSEVTSDYSIRHATRESDGLVHIDYGALTSESDDDTRLCLLHAIIRDGAALVRNAPLISSGPFSPVSVVGCALAGSLSHASLYGDVFHVQSIPNAHNIAYTSVPLQPHMDLAYYESGPGLQLLHCVSNDGIVGGESVLVDAMAAADYLRNISPHHFETLVRCSATFVKQREGADMIYRRPHIALQQGTATDYINGEIVAVTWSPPFEGPLCIPSHLVEDYYKAYAAFERMLDNSLPLNRNDDVLPPELSKVLRAYAEEHTWERRLEPGDLLVFNNRRMLHGRRGFSVKPETSPESHGRHLVGAYTNIDDTLNQYRCLLRNQKDRDMFSIRNVGNGSSGGP